jgi:tRNA dimethylallyltransferase
VGCKEIMRYLNGEWKLDFAIEKIKRNTRVYARKQLTWFKRDNEIKWFNLTEETDSIPQIIVDYLDSFPILQE